MKNTAVLIFLTILAGCNWNVNTDKFGEPGGPGLGQVRYLKVVNQTTSLLTVTVIPMVTTTSIVDYPDGPVTEKSVPHGELLIEAKTNLEPYAEPVGSLWSLATSRTYFLSIGGLPQVYSVAGCPSGYSPRSDFNTYGIFYFDHPVAGHPLRSNLLPPGKEFGDPFPIIVITITSDKQVVFSLDPTTIAKLVPVSGS